MKATQKTSAKNQSKKKNAKIIHLNANRKPAQLIKSIDGIWCITHAALWSNQQFTAKEIAQFKRLISDHFRNGKAASTNFKELVERTCLAKRYVARKRGRYISKPQDWLNIHYPLGLAGTSAWLQRVNEVRSEVPEYNKGIKTFAKTLLSFIESPGENSFHKCRKQLIEQRQFDLQQIFFTSIINLQYAL